MSADLGLAAGVRPVLAVLTPEGRNSDHRFFTGMAIAAALTAFIGFAPSYYLSSAFGGRPLTTLVHVHGASPPRGSFSSLPRRRSSRRDGPISIAAWAWPARYWPCCCSWSAT